MPVNLPWGHNSFYLPVDCKVGELEVDPAPTADPWLSQGSAQVPQVRDRWRDQDSPCRQIQLLAAWGRRLVLHLNASLAPASVSAWGKQPEPSERGQGPPDSSPPRHQPLLPPSLGKHDQCLQALLQTCRVPGAKEAERTQDTGPGSAQAGAARQGMGTGCTCTPSRLQPRPHPTPLCF